MNPVAIHRRRSKSTQIGIALTGCGLIFAGVTATAQSLNHEAIFEFDISPRQVVAGPSAPAGSGGNALLRIDSPTQTVGRVTLNGISASRVTLNAGHAGETGPVVAEFERQANDSWQLQQDTVFNHSADAAASGYYLRVDSVSGALRGQVLGRGWQLQVVHLAQRNRVPQLPLSGEAVAGIALDPDAGNYRVRVTSNGVDGIARAQLRAALNAEVDELVIELEASTRVQGVWGSGDINGKCLSRPLPAAALRAYRDGRLLFHLDVLEDATRTMRARLAPAAKRSR